MQEDHHLFRNAYPSTVLNATLFVDAVRSFVLMQGLGGIMVIEALDPDSV